MPQRRDGPISKVRPKEFDTILSIHNATEFTEATYQCIVTSTGAALHENKEATAKSTSQDGGMAVNFG